MIRNLVLLLLIFPSFVQAVCTLVWTPPNTSVDGDSLAPGDIAAYHVYVINKSDVFTKGNPDVIIQSVAPGVSDPLPNILCSDTSIVPGKKVAVTAVGAFGDESAFSNVLTNVGPNKPLDLHVEDI